MPCGAFICRNALTYRQGIAVALDVEKQVRFVFGFESRGGEGRRGVAVIVLYRLYRVEIASLLLRNK